VPTSWRIVKARHAHRAFDGEGARLYGGRWNSPGIRLIYTADSPALATLELLVHLNASMLLPSFVLCSVSFDDALATAVDRSALPRNWRSFPPPPDLAAIGDRWARARSSLALVVPSAVIDLQDNFLINPEHPDFSSVALSSPRPFDLDLRLVRNPLHQAAPGS
jgi:RES domain-containing protein